MLRQYAAFHGMFDDPLQRASWSFEVGNRFGIFNFPFRYPERTNDPRIARYFLNIGGALEVIIMMITGGAADFGFDLKPFFVS
ncbi:hypothetical protein D3C84_1224240 [compost metagenome]